MGDVHIRAVFEVVVGHLNFKVQSVEEGPTKCCLIMQ